MSEKKVNFYKDYIKDFLNESETEQDLMHIKDVFSKYFSATDPVEKAELIKLAFNKIEQGDYKNALTKDFLNSYLKDLIPDVRQQKSEKQKKYHSATFKDWTDYLKHAEDTKELFTPAILGHLITYRPSSFNLIVARPSTGKTTIQCDLIIEALEQGKKCIFFSIEEDAENIIDILVSAQYSFDTMKVLEENSKTGTRENCTEELKKVEIDPEKTYPNSNKKISFFAKMHAIGKAKEYLYNELFEINETQGKDYIDTLSKNFELRMCKAIRKIMNALQSKQLVLFTEYDDMSNIETITKLYAVRGDLVFIDYAQIIEPQKEGRYIAEWEQLKVISKQLASIAKDTQTILLVSAQFNRQGQSDDNTKLSLANIAGADNFARDATSAIGLRYIDKINYLTCTIMKNRKGIKNIEFRMANDFERRYLCADYQIDEKGNKHIVEYEPGTKTKPETKGKQKGEGENKKPQTLAELIKIAY